MRGRGKTNSLKVQYQKVSPLFVLDIRDEWTHVPTIRSYNEFLSKIMNGLGRQENLQLRFVFSSRLDLTRLFYIMGNFQNCTIIIDEADALFSVREFSNALTDLFLGSRNKGISMVFVAKRPFLLPILVRSQTDEFTIFCTEEEKDIRYLENRVRKDFPKDPYKLKQGEAIIVKPGETPHLTQFPKFSA